MTLEVIHYLAIITEFEQCIHKGVANNLENRLY